MEYRSNSSLFGLPFVHISTGRVVDGHYKRGVAKGWIAIGDISIGVLLSLGGVAVGGIALGGVSLGVVAIAGLSVGIYSFGGAAIGVWAVGGLAVGLYAAIGGAAIAFEYARGGVAIAEHANDVVAQNYFSKKIFFIVADKVARHSWWFILLAFIPSIRAIWKKYKKS